MLLFTRMVPLEIPYILKRGVPLCDSASSMRRVAQASSQHFS